MHVYISYWKNGVNQFAGDGYAGFSDTALYFIGGIIKHAKALNAFYQPQHQLLQAPCVFFEAPVMLVYSARNRSAILYSYVVSPKANVLKRFPDPTANPTWRFRPC